MQQSRMRKIMLDNIHRGLGEGEGYGDAFVHGGAFTHGNEFEGGMYAGAMSPAQRAAYKARLAEQGFAPVRRLPKGERAAQKQINIHARQALKLERQAHPRAPRTNITRQKAAARRLIRKLGSPQAARDHLYDRDEKLKDQLAALDAIDLGVHHRGFGDGMGISARGPIRKSVRKVIRRRL